jgi:hypothetical protein
MTTPERLLARRRPQIFNVETELHHPTIMKPAPGMNWFRRLFIAFEYATARRWKKRSHET